MNPDSYSWVHDFPSLLALSTCVGIMCMGIIAPFVLMWLDGRRMDAELKETEERKEPKR